jgi:hypothetical protein
MLWVACDQLMSQDQWRSPSAMQVKVNGDTVVNQLYCHAHVCVWRAASGQAWAADWGSFTGPERGAALAGDPSQQWVNVRTSNVRTTMAQVSWLHKHLDTLGAASQERHTCEGPDKHQHALAGRCRPVSARPTAACMQKPGPQRHKLTAIGTARVVPI